MMLGEVELIERLKSRLPSACTPAGIGEDCAVVKLPEGYAVLTSDTMVEGSHFLPGWKEKVANLHYLLGRKLVSISLSDIASTGGTPGWALVTVGVSPETTESELYELYDGIGDACAEFGCRVVGGDTVASKVRFFSSTVVGSARAFMLRRRASAGELVAVTGCLGDALAGLEILLKNLPFDRHLVMRLLNPTPRLKEGALALKAGVKCAIDVSDGLLFSLYLVAKASGVSIHIDKGSIPVSPELVEFAGKEKALDYAMFGGEDYELVITLPQRLLTVLEQAGFKVIGEVREGCGVFVNGERVKPQGFDHLRHLENIR